MNCGEIEVVGRFLSFECGCGPHSAVWYAHHTTVGVVLKPRLNRYILKNAKNEALKIIVNSRSSADNEKISNGSHLLKQFVYCLYGDFYEML